MAIHELDVPSFVRGYHVYRNIWEATVCKNLPCQRELNNRHDPFAVAVLRKETTVGHVPRVISAICSSFLQRGGSISCTVTGRRKYSEDLPQGGVEVPCTLNFKSPNESLLLKAKTLILNVQGKEHAVTKKPGNSQLVSQEIQSPDEKRFKFEKQSSNLDLDSETWVTGLPKNITLTLHNKSILINGHELNDLHMAASQALLMAKFPNIKGLSSTLAPVSLDEWNADYIQILHCNGNHWIAVSTKNCSCDQVNVYDSLYKHISE